MGGERVGRMGVGREATTQGLGKHSLRSRGQRNQVCSSQGHLVLGHSGATGCHGRAESGVPPYLLRAGSSQGAGCGSMGVWGVGVYGSGVAAAAVVV